MLLKLKLAGGHSIINQSLDLYCAIPQLCSWRRMDIETENVDIETENDRSPLYTRYQRLQWTIVFRCQFPVHFVISSESAITDMKSNTTCDVTDLKTRKSCTWNRQIHILWESYNERYCQRSRELFGIWNCHWSRIMWRWSQVLLGVWWLRQLYIVCQCRLEKQIEYNNLN